MMSNQEYENALARILRLYRGYGVSDDEMRHELRTMLWNEDGMLPSFMTEISDSLGIDPIEFFVELFIRLTMEAKPVARENINTEWMRKRLEKQRRIASG